MRGRGEDRRYDAVIVGGGHNALVAAALLARAGRSVVVLERGERVGGAAVSADVFPGARISRFAYLVSLFPAWLLAELGVEVELRARAFAAYTPGAPGADPAWVELHGRLARLGRKVLPTLTEPLLSREEFRRVVGDEELWTGLFERPLSELLETALSDDAARGTVLTDATIGTFAPAHDPELRQNRCFLYHVIGGGWSVPVGGMGALTVGLEGAARRAGAEIRTRVEVTEIAPEGPVSCADGTRYVGSRVIAGVAPAVLARLLGETPAEPGRTSAAHPWPEGSQLKLNLLVRRLPRPLDPEITPERAFTGTFHVNEGYEQLQRAYEETSGGRIPATPPCELYCHSLTDPSVLSAELAASGSHTLTLFGLHMPARLFAADPEAAKRAAVAATLASVNSALADPLEECLAADAEGAPCLEAYSPLDLERELGMPGGHIFHRDLSWPFAESEDEVGRWGAETRHPNILVCGAGARRGGCVSGIPGYNAARAVLEASG